MTGVAGLNAREEAALRRAVGILEGRSFVARLTDATGEPLTQLMKRLPAVVSRQINKAVRKTLYQTLDVALYKMDSGLPEPPSALFQVASGLTGEFQRSDMVEAAWHVVAPIQNVWGALDTREFPNYAAGTWGPKEADELLAQDGRHWYNAPALRAVADSKAAGA